ncbi:MAG: peptidylprolyl isomerase [Clostridia bacterium]|nr:peptidylprolyl isomerase [Clostridia bacterium]
MTNKKSGLLKKIGVTVLVVLAIAVVVGANVYNYITDTGVFARKTVAVSSDNYELTTAQMSYYFYSQYQNTYSMYAQYGLSLEQMGLDQSKSLKAQECTFSSNQTWFDYFMSLAVDAAEQQLALCEAAKDAGLELDDEDYADIDAAMDNLKETAKASGYSLKQFIKINYGTFVKDSDIKETIKLELLANKYLTKIADETDVSDEAIEKMYNDYKNNYDTVGTLKYTFNFEDIVAADEELAKGDSKDTSSDTSTEISDDVKFAAEAEAKVYADRLLAEGKDVESFKTVLKAYFMEALHMTEDEAKKELDKEAFVSDKTIYNSADEGTKWAFDEAKVGDIKMFELEEDHDHEEGEDESKLAHAYKVMLVTSERSRDESISYRDVRHILFTKETYKDDTKAKEVYDKWVADGAKVEDFIELAKEYSEDPGSANDGGLYEGVTEGQMVEEFDAWLFDEARAEGDYALVETKDYGWHIMYYEGGIEGYKGQIMSEIKTDAQTAATEAAAEDYAVKVINDALDEIPA